MQQATTQQATRYARPQPVRALCAAGIFFAGILAIILPWVVLSLSAEAVPYWGWLQPAGLCGLCLTGCYLSHLGGWMLRNVCGD